MLPFLKIISIPSNCQDYSAPFYILKRKYRGKLNRGGDFPTGELHNITLDKTRTNTFHSSKTVKKTICTNIGTLKIKNLCENVPNKLYTRSFLLKGILDKNLAVYLE